MRAADNKGTDVRLAPFQIFHPKTWPRTPINTHFWCWKVIQSYPFKSEQHINVLELRALFNYIRYRAKKLHKLGSRSLIILDSQVVVSIAAEGRSSSQQLNPLLQRLAAISIACNMRFIYAWCRSGANPADAPSRSSWVRKQS